MYLMTNTCLLGFPWWLIGKELSTSAGDMGSTPGSGRPSIGRNDNSFQYSCLGNLMNRRA